MVSEPTVADATNRIYESLQADNADLDAHIATLKAALAREGLKEAVFDPARLAQNQPFWQEADAGLLSAARRNGQILGFVKPSHVVRQAVVDG